MEIKLCAIRCMRMLRQEELAALRVIVPPERLAELDRQKDPERRQEVLLAYGALQVLLLEEYGWNELPRLSYGENDKPCFAEHPEVFFNLSHTRGAALAGISDHPIGVDMEKCRAVSARMRRAFPEAKTERNFWDGWVRRESAVKRVGGSIISLRNRPRDAIEGECFFPLEPFEGYAACVCTADKTMAVKLKSFTME